MPLDLYHHPYSGPCRAVSMTAKVVGCDLNLKHVDLFNGDHMKPEFLKLNPRHCVPFLVDGDLCISESRAIVMYIAEKYSKDDKLYPKDLKKRAIVNQWLFFDSSYIYVNLVNYYAAIFGSKLPNPADFVLLEQSFESFDELLARSGPWLTGDSLTIADIVLLATVSQAEVMACVDVKKFPNVFKWYTSAKKEVKGFEESYKSILEYKEFYDQLVKESKLS